MSQYKIVGSCTKCDARCYEVTAMQGEADMYPGEPKQIGAPLEGAVRITFMLMDGTKTFLTFCERCAAELDHESYPEIWKKNIRSWMRELARKPENERMPEWFTRQFSNGLLCEMRRQLCKEAVQNG